MMKHKIYLNIKNGLLCDIIQRMSNLNKKDLFAPYYIFPFVYILYFTFGSIELTNLSYPSIESRILIILGLIFYLIGNWTSLKIFNNEKFYNNLNESGTTLEMLIKLFIILNVVCTIVAIVIQSVFYGAPILDPNLRMTMPPKLLGIIAIFPLAISYFLSIKLNEEITKNLKILYIALIFFVGIIITLFTAYRTIFAIFFLTFLLIINYSFKKLRIILISMACLVFVVIIIGLQQYRLQETIGSSSFDYLNPHGYPNILIAAHLPCHEGARVFSEIVNLSPISGLLHGQFLKMSLSVILPGTQLGANSFISLLMGSSNLESGTTSSILGGPYLDFGIFGIAIFMFLVGLILTLLHTNLMRFQNGTFGRSISVVSYAYSLVIFLISIHVDFFAVIILIISLSFVIFIQIIVSRWYKNSEIMAGVGIILIIVAAILLAPSMFDETKMEHVAIDYCDTNLNHSNKILIDKYSVATGLNLRDNRFQFYLDNMGKGASQITEYFFVNEKPPILSSGLSVKFDGTTADKFYTNNYINIYDRR